MTPPGRSELCHTISSEVAGDLYLIPTAGASLNSLPQIFIAHHEQAIGGHLTADSQAIIYSTEAEAPKLVEGW